MKKPDETRQLRLETLINALLSLKNAKETESFLDDLCTPAEREAMADRWMVVQKLTEGTPYRQIAEETGVSVTTVTRVARCLNRENSGYKKIYERVKNDK